MRLLLHRWFHLSLCACNEKCCHVSFLYFWGCLSFSFVFFWAQSLETRDLEFSPRHSFLTNSALSLYSPWHKLQRYKPASAHTASDRDAHSNSNEQDAQLWGEEDTEVLSWERTSSGRTVRLSSEFVLMLMVSTLTHPKIEQKQLRAQTSAKTAHSLNIIYVHVVHV